MSKKEARKAQWEAQRKADARALQAAQANAVAVSTAAEVAEQEASEDRQQEDAELMEQDVAESEHEADTVPANQALTQALQEAVVCCYMPFTATRVPFTDTTSPPGCTFSSVCTSPTRNPQRLFNSSKRSWEQRRRKSLASTTRAS